jgi:hypothetical protein
MSPYASSPYVSGTPARQGVWSWPARAEAWLDARGRKAWVVAIILSFIFFWPAGLALLGYALWSNKMSCMSRRQHHHDRVQRWGRDWSRSWDRPVYQSSGNTAFDAYKDSTLKRLEEEQAAFAAFLQRLRDAKDKQEFDSFMEDRARQPREMPARDVTPDASGNDTPRNGDY